MSRHALSSSFPFIIHQGGAPPNVAQGGVVLCPILTGELALSRASPEISHRTLDLDLPLQSRLFCCDRSSTKLVSFDLFSWPVRVFAS